MLKTIVVPLTLALLSLFSNGSNNSVARLKQNSPESQTGTLEKMMVADGSAAIDIDLNRLNGIGSRSQMKSLRFIVAPNSFFTILVFNKVLRGPELGSMALIPQSSAILPAALNASFNQLVIEKTGWTEPFDLVVRDGKTGFIFFNIEGNLYDYDDKAQLLSIKEGRLLISEEFAEQLGRPAEAGSVVGRISITATMRPIEITQVVNGEATSSVLPPLGSLVPGPDVIVGELPAVQQFGSSGTQVGLAVATDSCNAGAEPLHWFALPNNDHPVIPQNLYRMSGGATNDERFEQVGQSWLKHAFTALQQNACGFGCQSSGTGTLLGAGCSDPYSASLNGSQGSLGSRAWVNPFTGAFPGSSPSPNSHTGHSHTGVSHRVVVETSDLNTSLNPGATYFAEAQYVTPHEYAWCQSNPGQCNMNNNASYRRFSVSGTTSFTFAAVGSTVRTKAAVGAWTGATINPLEPAPGVDGIAFVSYKVTNPSPGVWHYEYAVYNQNLDRAIQSFSVPLAPGITISNVGFHAPPQPAAFANDGTVGSAGYSSTPWTPTQTSDSLTWNSETFAQNPNANAIRWGTLYNFRFDSDQPPQTTNGTIGFFETGTPMSVQIQGPSGAGPTPTPTPTPPPQGTNVALASNGGVATASSTFSANYAVTGINNGDRNGNGWGAGSGGWNDATENTYPDSVEVAFNGSQTINEIDIFTVQDNFSAPSPPTDSTTFTRFGITHFDVQYWTGSAWVNVPGGAISGNNLVWRKLTFADIITTKVRIQINNSLAGYSRITEIEAYTPSGAPTPTPTPTPTPPPQGTNVALASNGGVATASSTFSANYAVTGINNGERNGNGWASGSGGWNDATQNAYPDSVEIAFSGSQTITEIDVFTLQDNFGSPSTPTELTTFSLYGITHFDVQYWSGSDWVNVPGGAISGNNLVWRRLTFDEITTTKIRVLVNNSLAGYSRITEIEAYAPGPLPSGFTSTLVAGGIPNPTAMAFAPDGRLFVCQQTGQLRVISNSVLLPDSFVNLAVNSSGERGLLGVAFDPDFTNSPFVYVYYTTASAPIHNRVSRFAASGDVAVGSEIPLLELDNLGETNHNGGAIHFGTDGKLYIATGENAVQENAQTLGNMLGKILRLNPDGTIPNDNPFFNTATGNNRSIWALGLRNPYTFAFQPGTGRMFINDVGAGTWEEINDGIASSNYGWNICEGTCGNPSFRDPIFQYGHGSGFTTGCAITGGAFYNPSVVTYPGVYVGKYFYAEFCSGWIRRFDPGTGTATRFATGLSFPVDLKVGPDGNLYYLVRGGGGSVFKITFAQQT
ncbi:MAG: PQQ-dependent sugar dehydrogenase [Pyrinomonadaceae bacterium]